MLLQDAHTDTVMQVVSSTLQAEVSSVVREVTHPLVRTPVQQLW